MDSINYQFHKFAGYLLFPLRLLVLVISTFPTIFSIYILDILRCNQLGNTLLQRNLSNT